MKATRCHFIWKLTNSPHLQRRCVSAHLQPHHCGGGAQEARWAVVAPLRPLCCCFLILLWLIHKKKKSEMFLLLKQPLLMIMIMIMMMVVFCLCVAWDYMLWLHALSYMPWALLSAMCFWLCLKLFFWLCFGLCSSWSRILIITWPKLAAICFWLCFGLYALGFALLLGHVSLA